MNIRDAARNPVLWIPLLCSGIVAFLIWQVYFKAPPEVEAGWVSSLPAIFSTCNALSAGCVVAGLVSIRRGRRDVHVRFMLTALLFSAGFLVLYIIYHQLHGDVPFPGQGIVRPIYFSILISHIALSIVALPMVLTTFYFAVRGRFDAHRRLARVTAPIWLYVSVTGVAVFFFSQAWRA